MENFSNVLGLLEQNCYMASIDLKDAYFSELLSADMVSIRFLARVIGHFVSSFPAVEFGELCYRYLELAKDKALKLNKGNFDARVKLDSDAVEEVYWY